MTTQLNFDAAAANLSVRILNEQAFFNNPKWSNHVLNNLHIMRKQGLFCDVTLEVQNNDGLSKTSVPAHACVLASSSQLFYDVLDRETRNRQVLLKSFDVSILNICLDYIYGQPVIIPTREIQDLSAAASTLQIKSLMLQCSVAQTAIASAGVESMDHLIIMKDNAKVNEEKTDVQEQNETERTLDSFSGATPSGATSNTAQQRPLLSDKQNAIQKETIDYNLNGATMGLAETPFKRKSTTVGLNETPFKQTNDSVIGFTFQDAFAESFNDYKGVTSNILPSVSGLSSRQETNINLNKPNYSNKLIKSEGLKMPRAVLKIKGNSVSLKDLPPEIRKALKRTPKSNLKTKISAQTPSKSPDQGHKTSQQPKSVDSYVKGFVSIGNPIPNIPVLSGNELILPENYVALKSDMPASPDDSVSHSDEQDQTNGTKKEPGWVYRHRVQPMRCDHCNRMFAGLAGLKQHKNRLAKNPNLRIPPRNKEERKLKNQLRHQRQRDKMYTCEECGMQVKGWHNLFKHRRVNHKKTLVCKYCNKAFAYPNQLKVHESRHVQDKNFMCSFCEYRAVTKKEVEYHEQLQHLDIRFPCPECKIVFKCDMYLQRHIRSIHKKGPLKCKYCDYSCVSNSYLKTHVLNKHFPDKRQPWKCNICEKKFTNKGHLDRHLKDVHRTTPTPKRFHTVNTNQPTINQGVHLMETNPVASTAPAIDQGDFQVDSSILKQGLGDFVGYLRTDDGNILRVDNSNVKFENAAVLHVDNSGIKIEENVDHGYSQDQVQSSPPDHVSPETLIASGVHVEANEEVVYYEDDTYI